MLQAEAFLWTPAAEMAYKDIKEILTSSQVLMPYDPTLPLLLATDASKTGLGAVLSHQLSNGLERPIAYASRTMTVTEQRYPQIDKEALAIVSPCRNSLTIYMHVTLLYSQTTSRWYKFYTQPNLHRHYCRMANYTDYMAHFNYEVIYKSSKANANADYCSRAPLPMTVNSISESIMEDEFDDFICGQITQLPVRANCIASETRKDDHLGKIVRLLEKGTNLPRFGYKAPEANYSLATNCLLFEHRVVIPPSLRQSILNDLHTAHSGMVKMKGIARSFVYWSGIDTDIEKAARACTECAKHASFLRNLGTIIGNILKDLGNAYTWTMSGQWQAQYCSLL